MLLRNFLMKQIWNIMHSEQRRNRHETVSVFGHSGRCISWRGYWGLPISHGWQAAIASPDDGDVVRL